MALVMENLQKKKKRRQRKQTPKAIVGPKMFPPIFNFPFNFHEIGNNNQRQQQ